MATKEELEEKEEDCESTEEFVELAKEVVKELSDKEWAGNLIEEAVAKIRQQVGPEKAESPISAPSPPRRSR